MTDRIKTTGDATGLGCSELVLHVRVGLYEVDTIRVPIEKDMGLKEVGEALSRAIEKREEDKKKRLSVDGESVTVDDIRRALEQALREHCK